MRVEIYKQEVQIAGCGKLLLEEAMDLSYNILWNE
jgi:hypothetical protein